MLELDGVREMIKIAPHRRDCHMDKKRSFRALRADMREVVGYPPILLSRNSPICFDERSKYSCVRWGIDAL